MLPASGSTLSAQEEARRNRVHPTNCWDEENMDIANGSQTATATPWPFARANIFTVPQHLREERPAAYLPFILVMGPYHRERESAEIAAVKIFSARKRNTAFQELCDYVDRNIAKYMEMYDRKLQVEAETLSRMLAHDAFLLSDILSEYASRNYPLQKTRYNDYVLPRRHFWTILRDLMLMENQIPIEILKEAMDQKRDFEEDVTTLVKFIYPFRRIGNEFGGRPDFSNCHHLLELFYRSCTFKGGQPDDKAERSDIQIPTATQLRAAGIHIRGVEGDLRSIAFHESKRTLQMPMIKMYSETETWFRNLMAYEQCREMLAYEECKEVLSVHWCSYMRLMGCLIDTAEDVKLLTEKKVLVNLVGSNEGVAHVWNSFGVKMELFLTKRDEDVMNRINEYCGCKHKVWWAECHFRYCSRPWSFISLLAASLLLVLTFLQTLFSFYHQ